MKDQYFGDVNDYRKYGLLRALQSHGSHELLVAWMLTPDDGGRNGAIRGYLEKPKKWRDFDPELYDGLRGLLRRRRKPRVSLIESTDLLPRTSYFSAKVPDGREEREAWRGKLLESASGKDLVFLDPDNGLEIPSKSIGCQDSSKFAAWQDVEALWEQGCSLLIYQHFPRKPRPAFTQGLADELHRRLGTTLVRAFGTAHVLFLLVTHPRHRYATELALAPSLPSWRGQIDPWEIRLPDNDPSRLFCPFDGFPLIVEEKTLDHWTEFLRCPHCGHEYLNQIDMRNIYPPARVPDGTIRAVREASPEKLSKCLAFGTISDAYNVLPHAFWETIHDLPDPGGRIMEWFGNVEVTRRFFVSENPEMFPKSYRKSPCTPRVKERHEELKAHFAKREAARKA